MEVHIVNVHQAIPAQPVLTAILARRTRAAMEVNALTKTACTTANVHQDTLALLAPAVIHVLQTLVRTEANVSTKMEIHTANVHQVTLVQLVLVVTHVHLIHAAMEVNVLSSELHTDAHAHRRSPDYNARAKTLARQTHAK